MNLDESQKQKVAEWISQGLKLSEIQNRLVAELGVRLTYMEVRMLVDDLKLTPKDVEPAKAASLLEAPGSARQGSGAAPFGGQPAAAAPGGVTLSVDQIARPGAVVSGRVTFSDGQQAGWSFDQTGRLGLSPQTAGYRPTTADMQAFQTAMETELSRMGF